MPADFEQIYSLLENVTPLAADCGSVCGAACCRDTGQDSGMLLFPGEQDYLAGHFPASCFRFTRDGGGLLICEGKCERPYRPLACRMFPLFPYLDKEGRIRTGYDPRAVRLCPLTRLARQIAFERPFVRAVRQTGRLLAADGDCRRFLQEQSIQLEELGRLMPPLRSPIQRRKVDIQ